MISFLYSYIIIIFQTTLVCIEKHSNSVFYYFCFHWWSLRLARSRAVLAVRLQECSPVANVLTDALADGTATCGTLSSVRSR